MDKSKFTEVKGIEALKILMDGGELTSDSGRVYRLNEELGLYFTDKFDDGCNTSAYTLTEVVTEQTWYIPKPFDIRDAALERPNEWVGAYQDVQTAKIYKVGFDKEMMGLVEAEYDNPFDCSFSRLHVHLLDESVDFDDIFPIEQVKKPSEEKVKAFDTDVPF